MTMALAMALAGWEHNEVAFQWDLNAQPIFDALLT